VEGKGFSQNQRLKNWHLSLPRLAFTRRGLVVPVSVKMTGWGIMFICGMVCWHINTRLESGPVTADLTTTVIHTL